MDYKQELINRIKKPDRWPEFDRPDFLNELNSIADDAFEKNTIEGHLAALLIYHQLCEEIVRLILRDAQFFIKLAVFPAEINFPEKKRLMFGQLIEELKSTLSFRKKDELIEKCLELNKYRIDIVHHLTKRTSLSDLQHQVNEAKSLYEEIFDLFEDAHDFFRVCFKDYKKDVDWDEYLE